MTLSNHASHLATALAGAVTGPVLRPEDSGFTDELAGFQRGLRHRPDLVVGARGASDVRTVVRLAGNGAAASTARPPYRDARCLLAAVAPVDPCVSVSHPAAAWDQANPCWALEPFTAAAVGSNPGFTVGPRGRN